MYSNHWLDLAYTIVEKEVLLVKLTHDTKKWYDKMPASIRVIAPTASELLHLDDFHPIVGKAHHLRLCKYGIEGVLKVPKKFHRYSLSVFFDKIRMPSEPFWIVLRRNQ